jgi:hypothetical protein
VDCLGKIQAAYQHVLYGDADQPPISIMIKGTNAQTYIRASCNSLNSCVDVVRTKHRDLGMQAKSLEAFKTKYVQNAYQSAELGAVKIAAQLNGPSFVLQQRLQKMNAALLALGERGMNFPPLNAEPLDRDENGLPVVPRDMVGFIGSHVNPRLPDTSELNSGGGVAHSAEKMEQKAAQLETALEKLRKLPLKCAKEANQKIADSLEQQRSAAVGSCESSRYCAGGRLDAGTLQTTQQVLEMLGEAPSRKPVDIASLSSGVQSFCDPPAVSPGLAQFQTQKANDDRQDAQEKEEAADDDLKDEQKAKQDKDQEEVVLAALEKAIPKDDAAILAQKARNIKNERDRAFTLQQNKTNRKRKLERAVASRKLVREQQKGAAEKNAQDQSKRACDQFMQSLVTAKSKLDIPESVRSRSGKGSAKKAK